MQNLDTMGAVFDFAVNVGVETVKEKIEDASAEKQVRQRLTEYLEKQKKLNNSISLEEEIDFEELCQYISQNMMDDIKKRFWGDKHERRQARKTIIQKACSFASANTKLSRRRVMKIVSDVTDILSNYYRSRINRELLFVKGEIEDTVVEQGEETRRVVKEEAKQLKEIITNGTAMSIDKAFGLIDEGQIGQVGERVGDFMNGISAKHTLFPYYGFRMNTSNRIISFPLSDSAREKYPENYRLTLSSARLGNQPVFSIDRCVLSQSYRHQLPIYIDIQTARKYLGNTLDPIQSEAEDMAGTQAIIRPPEFPKAFPCNVVIGNDVVVPYLLLRTKEILDDGAVIFTNEEQRNYHFAFSATLDLSNKRMTFTVTPANPSNKECLSYRLFLKRAWAGEQITVNLLQLNERFLQGTIDKRDPETLEAEIEFLKRIVKIEEYFNTNLVIPENITNEDYMIIDHVYKLICGQYVSGWETHELKMIISNETSQKIKEMSDICYVFECEFDAVFSLFNKDLNLQIIRQIDCAKIDNLDRLKQKMTVLDEGDEVMITLIPGNDQKAGKYIERIKSDGVKSSTQHTG